MKQITFYWNFISFLRLLPSTNGFSKLLVTTGIDGNYVTKSEVLDLLDPKVRCDPWVDYPMGVFGAVGTLIQNKMIICGGSSSEIDAITNCYVLEPYRVTEINGLQIGSFSSGYSSFNDSLFVAGGYRNSRLTRTEYITEMDRKNGPEIPIEAEGQCIIQINENEILLTGGLTNNGTINKTWFYNHQTEKWTNGPDTIESKSFHACGKFKIDGIMVLVLAGGTYITSVEFLVLNDQNWIPGPSLPFYPTDYSRIVVNENQLYFIDTFQNMILTLDCPTDLFSCNWKEMEQKLEYPRKYAIVSLIPDSLASCSFQ